MIDLFIKYSLLPLVVLFIICLMLFEVLLELGRILQRRYWSGWMRCLMDGLALAVAKNTLSGYAWVTLRVILRHSSARCFNACVKRGLNGNNYDGFDARLQHWLWLWF